jgi:hypothetical protein
MAALAAATGLAMWVGEFARAGFVGSTPGRMLVYRADDGELIDAPSIR